MPTKGAEYALLQRKYQFENILQTVASHRERAREREKYMRASYRSTLEQQRASVQNGLERMPVPTRQYYLEQLGEIDKRIQKRCTQAFKAHTIWLNKNLNKIKWINLFENFLRKP